MEIGTIVYLTEPCKWRRTPNGSWDEYEYPIGTPLKVIGDSGLRGPDLEFVENGIQMHECRFVKYSTQNPLYKKHEFKVGEEFQCGLVKLRCEKDKSVCEGCVFDSIDVMCDDLIFITGHCSSDKREDKTDVIFVKV